MHKWKNKISKYMNLKQKYHPDGTKIRYKKMTAKKAKRIDWANK